MNKDPITTQNAKKVLIKDQVLKIRTLLEAVVTVAPNSAKPFWAGFKGGGVPPNSTKENFRLKIGIIGPNFSFS